MSRVLACGLLALAAAFAWRGCSDVVEPSGDVAPTVSTPRERPRGASRAAPDVTPTPVDSSSADRETPEGFVQVRVRDAASTSPVPGLVLRLAGSGDEGQRTWTADADGLVSFELEDAEEGTTIPLPTGLQPAHEPWWCADDAPHDPEFDERVLWVARRVRVEGRIVDQDGSPLPAEIASRANATLRPLGPPTATLRLDESRGRQWWRRSGWSSDERVRLDEGGRFAFDGLLSPDFGVLIRECRGHRNETVRLPADAADGVVRLTVRMTPARIHSGRVVDPDGNPVPGVAIDVTAIHELPRAEAERFDWRRSGGGAGFLGGAETVRFMWKRDADTTDDGSFSVPMDVDHRSVVTASHPDYGTVSVHVAASDPATGLVLQFAAPRDTPPVVLLRDGEPLAETVVHVNDMDDDPVQVTLPRMKTDAEGRLPTGRLVRGRRYVLIATGARGGPRVKFVWGGQSELVLPSSE